MVIQVYQRYAYAVVLGNLRKKVHADISHTKTVIARATNKGRPPDQNQRRLQRRGIYHGNYQYGRMHIGKVQSVDRKVTLEIHDLERLIQVEEVQQALAYMYSKNEEAGR